MTRFRAYKSALISRLGRGPLDNIQIEKIGQAEFGSRWAGVFASDRTLPLLRMRDRFAVVNTATSRGRGSHWLGVYMSPSGTGWLYDSFGREASHLIWRMNRAAFAANVRLHDANSIAEQRGTSAVCGHLSLSFLLCVRDLGIRETVAGISLSLFSF